MNVIIIKILGFFVGLFITLFLIDYFDIRKKKIETFELKTPIIPVKNDILFTPTNINNDAFIPYNSHKFMCINTFFDITKIDNNINRWYECDLQKEKYSKIKINENHYFTFDKIINIKPNTINDNGSYGADINAVELRGPKSFYFANNIETNELNEFTILMSIKIKDITSKNNILFELTGNTEIVNDIKPKYLISIVNLNIRINEKNNYDFIITIGDSIYNGEINNIEKTTLKNNDFIIIGLIYTIDEITFLLNKQVFKYKTKQAFKVKLGSTPIIINKQGLMNINLYSFVYYKSALPSSEYLLFFKHNYYYLSGLNNIIETSQKKNEVPLVEVDMKNDLDIKLRELENKIDNKLNKKIEQQIIQQPELKYQDITPFNIDKISETNIDSPLGFLF